jgi:hypothetical protein
MFGQHSYLPFPRAHLTPGDGKRAVSAGHTSRQNLLLAALPLTDYERLLPHLKLVPLPVGRIVQGQASGYGICTFSPRESFPSATKHRTGRPQDSRSRAARAQSASHLSWAAKAPRARRWCYSPATLIGYGSIG